MIELIVVLVLIGVAIAVTAPYIFWTLERVQIRGAVKEISTTLRHCRNKAISEKERIFFTIDMDSRQYWMMSFQDILEFRKLNEDYDEDEIEEDESLYKMPPRINKKRIHPLINIGYIDAGEEKNDRGVVSITFSPFGSSSGGTIHIETSEETKRPLSFEISVDPVTSRVQTKEIKEE